MSGINHWRELVIAIIFLALGFYACDGIYSKRLDENIAAGVIVHNSKAYSIDEMGDRN